MKLADHFREKTQQMLEFIEASPTPFHCVENLKNKFLAKGFKLLREEDPWNLEAGGKYFVVRHDSSFCSFILGRKAPQEAGVRVIGAHTDSPNLRLKPVSPFNKAGYLQLGVEVYGGVLIASWADRDLSIAGRVITQDKKGKPLAHLVRINAPMARIPQLAIHLNRKVNEDGLLLNKQTHLPPIISVTPDPLSVENILEKAGVALSGIVSYDLHLYDTQNPVISGIEEEFVYSPRLDNQAMCFSSSEALLATADDETDHTRLIICFDHEEVGSVSAQGGNSSFLKDVFDRLVVGEKNAAESAFRMIARSFLISADMAHAVHPNYEEFHEPQHLPLINGGPVVKTNSNQRYASNGETIGTFLMLCKQVDIPVQHLVTRTDLSCGSTIGPMTTAKLGIRGVDVGNPMLSMHSIREMAGTKDSYWIEKAFLNFFKVADLPIAKL